MQHEMAAIEQSYITCWHSISSYVEGQHYGECTYHSDNEAVVRLVVYSDRETNILCYDNTLTKLTIIVPCIMSII
jgi:hypothetical protein